MSSSPGSWTSVWALSGEGAVCFRTGVCAENVIGHEWVRHPLPCDGVAVHLSTDAIGRPWATTSEGEVYLRRGVTAQLPEGESWVGLPDRGVPFGTRIVECSGGEHTAWATTSDESTLVRRGMNASTTGDHWDVVPGKVVSLGLCPDEMAAWAASATGLLFIRSGMTPYCTAGLQWKKIQRPSRWTGVKSVFVSSVCAIAILKDGTVWMYSGSPLQDPPLEANTSLFGSLLGSAPTCWHELKWRVSHVSVSHSRDLWMTTPRGAVLCLACPVDTPGPMHSWVTTASNTVEVASLGFVAVSAGASPQQRRPGGSGPTLLPPATMRDSAAVYSTVTEADRSGALNGSAPSLPTVAPRARSHTLSALQSDPLSGVPLAKMASSSGGTHASDGAGEGLRRALTAALLDVPALRYSFEVERSAMADALRRSASADEANLTDAKKGGDDAKLGGDDAKLGGNDAKPGGAKTQVEEGSTSTSAGPATDPAEQLEHETLDSEQASIGQSAPPRDPPPFLGNLMLCEEPPTTPPNTFSLLD